MNFAFFSHRLERDGAPLELLELANLCASDGHQCHVYSPYSGPIQEDMHTDIQVHIHESLENAGSYNASEIQNILQDTHFDVCIINTLINHHLVQILRKAFPNIIILWIIHESNPAHIQRTLKTISYADFSEANAVIFPCNATKEVYTEYNTGNFYAIPNGTNVHIANHFCSQHTKQSIRLRYGIPISATVVLHIGTMVARKGGEEIAQVAVDLLNQMPHEDLYFFLLGPDGSPFDTSKNSIEQTISHNGKEHRIRTIVPTKNVYDFLRMSDIFVHFSYIEAFPRVILEAMSFGLPVVATDVFGIPEQVRHNTDGILVKPANRNQLQSALHMLISDAKKRAMMGGQAKQRAHNTFSKFEWIEKIYKIIEQQKNITPPTTAQSVAVVIPCHNYGAYLSETIESVLQQTHTPQTILVVDDASTDNTESICKQYELKGVQYAKQTWNNVSLARNYGLMHINEEYVIFLDADDKLPPNYILQCVASMQSPEIAMTYGDWHWFGDIEKIDVSPDFSKETQLRSNYISSHAMFRRSVLESVGGYKDNVPHEDWDITRRIIQAGWTAKKADTFVYKRQHAFNRYDRQVQVGLGTHYEHIGFGSNPLTVFSAYTSSNTHILESVLLEIKQSIHLLSTVWIDSNTVESDSNILRTNYTNLSIETKSYVPSLNTSDQILLEMLFQYSHSEYTLILPQNIHISAQKILSFCKQITIQDDAILLEGFGENVASFIALLHTKRVEKICKSANMCTESIVSILKKKGALRIISRNTLTE